MTNAKSRAELESELTELRARLRRLESADRERAAAQAALKESEEKYRNTADASLVGIYVIQDLTFKYANPFFCQLFGYTAAELVGHMSPADLVVEEQQAAVRQNLLRRASGEPGRPYEVKCRRKDGSVFHTMVWGKASTFQGRPASVGTLVDITEQKIAQDTLARYGDQLEAQVAQQTEQLRHVNARLQQDIVERKRVEDELRASEEKLRALINASQEDVVILLNADGRFEVVNERAARGFCRSVDQIIGRSMMELLPPEIAASRWSKAAEVLQHGHSIRFEDQRAGRWYENNFCPVFDPEGKAHSVAIFARDITARKRLHLALTKAKEDAERANLAKSRFLAAANHDLRQPLQALALFLGALSIGRLEPREKRLLQDMQEALKIMEDLLNSLLDISKLEAGVITPDIKNFSTAALFHHLFIQFKVLSKELGVKIRLYPCDTSLRTDPVLLSRIIQNFVSNAMRHTRSGKILVGCRRVGDRRRIEVWDQGQGIPTNELERIFEEFHQIGEPSRNRHQGLGLGLAIAKKMSGLLNLDIGVRSIPGKGSVFFVEVPLGGGADAATAPAYAPVGESFVHTQASILLVEDNVSVLNATVHLLQLWGYQVLTAANADDALDVVIQAAQAPFMAILDYRLPGESNGVELHAELCRTLGRNLPGILVTGDSSIKRLQEVQACDLPLLHKPINTNELHRLVVDIEAQQRTPLSATMR